MKHPFNNSNVDALRISILKDAPTELPSTVSPFLRDIIC
jgi:hypothetical protein